MVTADLRSQPSDGTALRFQLALDFMAYIYFKEHKERVIWF